MPGNEDDKATVVIDINALKKEKERKEKEIAEYAGSLEFGIGDEEDEPRSGEKSLHQVPVLFFEFGGRTFAEMKMQLPSEIEYKILKDLPELNEWLKKKTPLVIVFAFDVNPKAINQLCAQLKVKFKLVHTVIVAKKLSAEKVKLHKASPAGAAGYVQYPFTKADRSQALIPILAKAAS
jgi:hypothetical protein